MPLHPDSLHAMFAKRSARFDSFFAGGETPLPHLLRRTLPVLLGLLVLGGCAPRCKTPPELGIVFDINSSTSFIQATGQNLIVDETPTGFNLLITHSSLSGEFLEMRIDVPSQSLTFFRMNMFGLNISNANVMGSTVYDFTTEEFECRNTFSNNDEYKSGFVDLELDLGAGPDTRMTIDWTAELP